MKKWFAVIGDPIKHSKSPEMHSFWYDALSENASYVPIHVPKEDLPRAVDSLKLLGASGFNVTIPHKEAIIPLLDEIDPLAEKMGAVNTVVRLQDGKLKGYNTDGAGFARSLEAVIGTTKRDQPLLIIGAGGAARGISFALMELGYTNITIANRTLEKAEKIVGELGIGEAITLQQAENQLDAYHIFIQTTPAGLNAAQFSTPFAMEKFPKQAVAADIVYNPLMTPFLLAAEEKGATIVNGLGMFVHQGAIAYELWLSTYPPIEEITQYLTKQL